MSSIAGGAHQGKSQPRQVTQRCPRLDRLRRRQRVWHASHDRGARPPARASPMKSQWRRGREPGHAGRDAASRRAPGRQAQALPAAEAGGPGPRRGRGAGRLGLPGLGGHRLRAGPRAAATRASGSTWPWPRSARWSCLFLCLLAVHGAAAPGRDPRGEAANGCRRTSTSGRRGGARTSARTRCRRSRRP